MNNFHRNIISDSNYDLNNMSMTSISPLMVDKNSQNIYPPYQAFE